MQKRRNSTKSAFEVCGEIMQATAELDSTTEWKETELEGQLLRTTLGGLLAVLNVHTVTRNNYEIEKAKYGGIGVPPRVEAAIEDVCAEIERKEAELRDVRGKLAALGTANR